MADRTSAVDKVGRETFYGRVLWDVFVDLSVLSHAIEACAVVGHKAVFVITFDDEVGFFAAIKADMEVFANAFASNVIWANVFFARVFELIACAFDGFDACGFAFIATALYEVVDLGIFFVASVNECLDSFSHDMNLLIRFLCACDTAND